MTPDDLLALREIEQLKYRYLRTLDLKDWDGFAATLAPEATGSYGGRLEFGSAEEIVAFMRQSVGPGIITVHQVHHPEITLSPAGDAATGTWALMDRVIDTEHRVLIEGSAVYRDEYRRGDDGRWLIARTGYERIYEATMSLEDVPSWRLTANRFAAAG